MYYGQFESESPEKAFEFLCGQILDNVKILDNIKELYVEHIGEITETSKGFKFRNYYGFDKTSNDMFSRKVSFPWAQYHHLTFPTHLIQ
jgi:hypothetical protein